MFIVVNEGSTVNTTKRAFFLSETKRIYVYSTLYGLIVVIINEGLTRLALLDHGLSVRSPGLQGSEARRDWAIGSSRFVIMKSFLIKF